MVEHMSEESIASRRQKAAKLFASKFSQADVARRCGVSRQTAMRWQRAFEAGGAAALKPGQAGRPTKLSAVQRRRLQAALLQGPPAHGWSTDLWTLERITTLIKRLFDVRYHPGHVWKLMRSMGWSLQRPTTKARERDEAAIARWKSEEWPRLKKTAETKSASSSSTKAASPKAR
jgi:transposase